MAASSGSAALVDVGAVVLGGCFTLAVGHTLYNAALRHLNATSVNLISTVEVVLAVVLAIVLFGEVPTSATILGGTISLFGVALVLR